MEKWNLDNELGMIEEEKDSINAEWEHQFGDDPDFKENDE